jgi:hypothetical protein
MEVPIEKSKLVVIASIGENPNSIKVGVKINPPPTPKKPESTLISAPRIMNKRYSI